MRPVAITQAFLLGLLASGPLAAAFTLGSDVQDVEKRHVGSLASMASKVVRAVIPEIEKRHHTEAQIAAKEAAADGKKHHNRQAPDEFGPWDSTEDEFGSWVDKKRSPHHTEAQIAAKEAAANGKKHHQSREPHHTEAQIAAKEAAADKKNHNHRRQEPDEFGPWDSTEDEFGSWVDKKRSPHHTEAQIAAKEAAANGKKHHQSREPHHTEAQIAAKEAAKGKHGGH